MLAIRLRDNLSQCGRMGRPQGMSRCRRRGIVANCGYSCLVKKRLVTVDVVMLAQMLLGGNRSFTSWLYLLAMKYILLSALYSNTIHQHADTHKHTLTHSNTHTHTHTHTHTNTHKLTRTNTHTHINTQGHLEHSVRVGVCILPRIGQRSGYFGGDSGHSS